MANERNIEIKASIRNADEFDRKRTILEQLTACDGEIILQKDVFFYSKAGRLKLRYLKNKKSELIYYDRPDVTGPKLSNYIKNDIDDPDKLEKTLAITNGTIGVVEKQRHLYLHKGSRIHLDNVEELGYFLEIEVCLRPEQTLEEGDGSAKALMELLEIRENDLIAGSYFDMIRQKVLTSKEV